MKTPSVVVICGPTASGKTESALSLAEKFPIEIISADSRQIYKYMDIGTGKDIPHDSSFTDMTEKFQSFPYTTGYHLFGQIPVWLYDAASPNQEFSAANFVQLALPVVNDIVGRAHLPVIVGGTGFFIESLLNPPASLNVKPNPMLRQELSKMSVQVLQDRLTKLSPERFNQMNQSDRLNPRRLIRAIEVAKFPRSQLEVKSLPALMFGLSLPLSELEKRINIRVKKRIDLGFDAEIDKLISLYGLHASIPGFSAIGYSQWLRYKRGEIDITKAVELWETAERQYAKRQITWFKKNSKIKWLNPLDADRQERVVRDVQSWYAK